MIKLTTTLLAVAASANAIRINSTQAGTDPAYYQDVADFADILAEATMYTDGNEFAVDLSQTDPDLARVIVEMMQQMSPTTAEGAIKQKVLDALCPGGQCNFDDASKSPEQVIADAVVEYFRGQDYAGDAGNRIAELLREEVRCAQDPLCGPGGSSTVYEWLENNYANQILNLDPTDDKYDFNQKRAEYYGAVAEVIADMVVYDIPETLLDEWLDFASYDEIITDDWKLGARKSIRDSFDEFDTNAYLLENAQTQVEHVTAHFRQILANHGQDDHQIPQ